MLHGGGPSISPSLRTMLTLSGGAAARARTERVSPPTDLMSRLDAFLPQMALANDRLPPDDATGLPGHTAQADVVERVLSRAEEAQAITPRRTRATATAEGRGHGRGEADTDVDADEAPTAEKETDVEMVERQGARSRAEGEKQAPHKDSESLVEERAVEMHLFVDNSFGELVPSQNAPSKFPPLIRELD